MEQRQQTWTKQQDVPSEHCKTFPVRVTEHWHRFFCGVSMLVNLQKPSGLNLSNQLQLAMPKQGDWTMRSAEVPFSFHHSVIKLKTEKMKAIFVKMCVAQMAMLTCLQFCSSLWVSKDITQLPSGSYWRALFIYIGMDIMMKTRKKITKYKCVKFLVWMDTLVRLFLVNMRWIRLLLYKMCRSCPSSLVKFHTSLWQCWRSE